MEPFILKSGDFFCGTSVEFPEVGPKLLRTCNTLNSVYLCLGFASLIPQPRAAGSPPQIQKRPSYRYSFCAVILSSQSTGSGEAQHTGSPFLSGCIAFTPWALILPLPFSAGLETFSQLVWKSAEGTVSMDSPRGLWDFLQKSIMSCFR